MVDIEIDKFKKLIDTELAYRSNRFKEIHDSINADLSISEKSTRLCEKEYKELIKSDKYKNKPLEKKYYRDQKGGSAFVQLHIRGLEPTEVVEWKKDELSFAKLIENHSVHADIRLKMSGLSKLVQYVLVESDIDSYLRSMLGQINPNYKNQKIEQRAKIVSKPSGEPPGYLPQKEEKNDGAILNYEGAKKVSDYIIHSRSYVITAGKVGASKDKDAYLGLVWSGKAEEGVQREGLHEYFFYPDSNLPELNKKLFDGRFIFRCFKTDIGNTWWMWKASKDNNPMNPYLHVDTGFHYLIPASDVKKFNKEDYVDYKNRVKSCKEIE